MSCFAWAQHVALTRYCLRRLPPSSARTCAVAQLAKKDVACWRCVVAFVVWFSCRGARWFDLEHGGHEGNALQCVGPHRRRRIHGGSDEQISSSSGTRRTKPRQASAQVVGMRLARFFVKKPMRLSRGSSASRHLGRCSLRELIQCEDADCGLLDSIPPRCAMFRKVSQRRFMRAR